MPPPHLAHDASYTHALSAASPYSNEEGRSLGHISGVPHLNDPILSEATFGPIWQELLYSSVLVSLRLFLEHRILCVYWFHCLQHLIWFCFRLFLELRILEYEICYSSNQSSAFSSL
jgi:hypothetical protein